MLEDGLLKQDDVILIYSQPPDECDIGIIEKYKYPKVILRLIKRDAVKKDKAKKSREIDLITDYLPITLLNKEKIGRVLTEKEKKDLNKVQKELESSEPDIFEEI